MEVQLVDTIQEGAMGTIVSHVPDLLKERGWGAMDLVRKGFAVDTSYRLAAGDTQFSLKTLRQLCDIFGVETVTQVIDYSKSDNGDQH